MPAAALSGTAIALIIAAALAQVALLVIALVDLVRRPAEAVTLGSKLPWFVIVILIEFIGPIVYLAAGRREIPLAEEARPVPGEATATGDRARHTVDVLYGPENDA